MTKSAELEKIWGEPVIDDFSESAYRAKRNLIVFSFLTLFCSLGGVTITGVAVIMFDVATSKKLVHEQILKALLIIVSYNLIHFSWIAAEHVKRNKIRLGGRFSKNLITTGIGHSDMSEEWNLYIWWQKRFKNFDDQFRNAKNRIGELLKSCNDQAVKNHAGAYVKQVQHAESFLNGMNLALERLLELEVPLNRYEKGYKSYFFVQRWRWFLLELGFPIILGVFAILSLRWVGFRESLLVVGEYLLP